MKQHVKQQAKQHLKLQKNARRAHAQVPTRLSARLGTAWFALATPFMLLFCPSLRADDIDQQIEAKANGEVVIVNHRGKVDLIGWDRHEVSVVGELDDLTENFIFERDGDRVRILVKMKRLQPWGDGSDLTIHVPAASQLRFRGVSTDRLSAISDEPQMALVHLQRAGDEGWRQHWRPTVEPSLSSLWEDGDFRAMMAGLQTRMDVMRRQIDAEEEFFAVF